jgi:hypothetical protein
VSVLTGLFDPFSIDIRNPPQFSGPSGNDDIRNRMIDNDPRGGSILVTDDSTGASLR